MGEWEEASKRKEKAERARLGGGLGEAGAEAARSRRSSRDRSRDKPTKEQRSKRWSSVGHGAKANPNQGIAYRIGNLSNAEISDFFVYRIVYRIEPPISCISIFSKPMIFLSFFAENSKNSPKIPRKVRKPMNQSRQQQQQRRKFQKIAENSENSLKIRRKFLK